MLVARLAQPGRQIDQSRCHDQACSVDGALGREITVDLAQRHQAAAGNRQVADAVQAAGRIDQAAAFN